MYTTELFEGKTLSDVFADIYKNTDSKRSQITTFITKLVQLIRTPEDATIIGPIIKEFLDVSVKNDEHIVRLAQIVQRLELVSNKTTSSGDMLTEEEKLQLLNNIKSEVKSFEDDVASIENDLSNLSSKL
jgi:hypothetical protein